MTTKTEYRNVEPYTTKDGSIIRELMHPGRHGNTKLSFAQATVPVGCETVLHRHELSEEIYHITAGVGFMTLNHKGFHVGIGDTILIPPQTPHKIRNTGDRPLIILCCCSPPYSHDDTELLS